MTLSLVTTNAGIFGAGSIPNILSHVFLWADTFTIHKQNILWQMDSQFLILKIWSPDLQDFGKVSFGTA